MRWWSLWRRRKTSSSAWVRRLDPQQRRRLVANLRELVESKQALERRIRKAAPLPSAGSR